MKACQLITLFAIIAMIPANSFAEGSDAAYHCLQTGIKAVAADPSAIKEVFKREFTPEFFQGEQELQGTTPLLSHPGNIVGRIFPSFGLLKNLPEEYQPTSGEVFPVYIAQMPASEMNVYKSRFADPSEYNSIIHPLGADGKPDPNIVQYYYHPLDREFIENKIHAPIRSRWGTPTSSGRTLGVLDESGNSADMLKLSLHAKSAALGGFIPKVNGPARVEKAVALSDAVHVLHQETGGVLPASGKTWDAMEEVASAIPKDPSLGGYIVRTYKPVIKPDEEMLTWYALFSKRPGTKKRWIDEMYEKSGYKSKLDFAWNELVKPVTELHTILAFKNDFATQLHQQNTIVTFDKKTMQVKRIIFRDIEGMSVGYTLRVHAMGKPPVTIGKGFDDSIKGMEYANDVENQVTSYFEKLRMESVKWAFTSFLDPVSKHILLRRMDAFAVEQFNQTFPNTPIKKISQLKEALTQLQAQYETPDETKAYAPFRGGSKKTDYLKAMSRIFKKNDFYTPDSQHH